jgi:pyridoxal phosphate enzyme (YggS family)|tara:strand:+ start:162 stop:812 length:651 start_codon:yes stop_codon:yes gene_type:complete
MMSIAEGIASIQNSIPSNVTLVAVSKTKPIEAIQEAYALGMRDFGENRPAELVEKANNLPNDIRWHAIGHLQRNKASMVTPISTLIHAVDSVRLYDALSKHAGEKLDVLIQIHIADEQNKHGFSAVDFKKILDAGGDFLSPNIKIRGLMGMATFTDNNSQIMSEFKALRTLFDDISPTFGKDFDTLSMGMSGDWKIAIDEGSTLIRVGSAIFGSRN